jgi:hypothetical protein
MSMPLWPDHGFELPEGIEVRKSGDTAALHVIGTDRVLGFVPSRFDSKDLPQLLERLQK